MYLVEYNVMKKYVDDILLKKTIANKLARNIIMLTLQYSTIVTSIAVTADRR